MYNILICDDQPDIVNALKIYLAPEGYNLLAAYNGVDAVKIAKEQDVHLILLDVMMPGMDGITATSKIREFSNVPIILLTAKSETEDKVLGLNVGADDYITKPFAPVEVLARVKSQLRRYSSLGSRAEDSSVITLGGISLDDRSKTVTVEGEPVNLTPTEYAILKLLMSTSCIISCSTPARSLRLRSFTAPCGTKRRSGSTIRWRYTSAICGKKLRSIPPSPAT